ncbi:MAG: NAD(P)/FAD-dependent oxidoreductase [Methanobacterium sp.]|uniref:geranylgeranyl reductase family protein n=1 Tax=Methanobacterium sp. TaxID=2164 RepID=UPI003C793AD7
MESIETDVLVIGAGPGGSSAAKHAAKNGVDVTLIDKKSELGAPKRCGEGVSKDGLKSVGIELNSKWITKELNGARLISPDGTDVWMGNNHVKFSEADYIIERKIFDKYLAMDASRAGANIMIKTLASDMKRENNNYIVNCKSMGQDFNIKSKIVIGADGIESRVGRWANLKTNFKPENVASGVQFEMIGVEMEDPNCIEFYFGSVAPGGYAWVFPKGDDVANVGLGIVSKFTDKSAYQHLQEFIAKCYATQNANPIEINTGGIPVGGMLKRIVSDNLMIVGDAAGQVNPLTGGGIISALKAGKYAGEVAKAAVKDGNYSKKRLEEYEKKCKTDFNPIFKKYLKSRNYIRSLSDNDIDSIFKAIQTQEIENINPSEIIKLLIKISPKAVLKLGNLF